MAVTCQFTIQPGVDHTITYQEYRALAAQGLIINGTVQISGGDGPAFLEHEPLASMTDNGDGTFTVKSLDGTTFVVATQATNNSIYPSYASAPKSDLSAFGIYLPEAHGAKGDGATDDASAVQAAFDAAPAGARVYLSKLYHVASTVTVSKQVKIEGTGVLNNTQNPASGLTVSSTTLTPLSIQASGCVLRDFSVVNATTATAPPTAGCGIEFTSTGHADYSRLENLTALGFYDGIRCNDGDYYTITNCFIFDPVHYGAFLSSSGGERQDHGDQTFNGCVISAMFVAGRNADSAVFWESGGGLRFINCKINGGEQPTNGSGGKFAHGLHLSVRDDTHTVDLIVTGSSIENCTTDGVYVHQQGPNNTGGFGNIVIVGNEIGLCGAPVDITPAAKMTPSGPGAYSVVIHGNTFAFCSSGINLTNVTGANIGPNDWGDGNPSLLYLGGATTDVTYDAGAQTVRGDNCSLLSDDTVSAGSHGPFSRQKFDLEREIPSTTSTTTYTPLYHFTPPQNHGASFEVVLEGCAVGVGPVVIKQRRTLTKGTGACTLATEGTDVATDAGAHVELLLDTATTSGDVYVKVRLHVGTTATDFAGRCYLRYDGPLYSLIKGA